MLQTWLTRELAERGPGVTVVTHSVVWRYIDEAEQRAIIRLLDEHGRHATRRATVGLAAAGTRPATGEL